MELLVPKYFREFSCIGSSCEDTCCVGWNVTVDKATFKKYKNLPSSSMKHSLDKNVKKMKNGSDLSYATIKMDENKACTFLDENQLCKIQSSLGAETLCNTCSTYPRSINRVDQLIEVSLVPSCPEALRLILQQKEGIEFEVIDDLIVSGYIMGKIDSNNQPDFWKLRTVFIEVLQNRKLDLDIRLIIIGLILNKIQSNKGEVDTIIAGYVEMIDDSSFIDSLASLPTKRDIQISVLQSFIGIRKEAGNIGTRYLESINDMLEGFNMIDVLDEEDFLLKYHNNYKIFEEYMNQNEHILENYLVNMVFNYQIPLNYSNYLESFTILAVHYSMIKIHLIGIAGKYDGLNDELVHKLIQSYSKHVEHNSAYLKYILDTLKANQLDSLAHIITFIKS